MEQPPAQTPPPNALIEQRKTNLAKLNAKGINPFANKFTPHTRLRRGAGQICRVSRRKAATSKSRGIPAHRDMGKSQFMDLKDGGTSYTSPHLSPIRDSQSSSLQGRIQIYAWKQTFGEDFLVAFEHGLPPAGSIGIGIDRLCMMLLGQESIHGVMPLRAIEAEVNR